MAFDVFLRGVSVPDVTVAITIGGLVTVCSSAAVCGVAPWWTRISDMGIPRFLAYCISDPQACIHTGGRVNRLFSPFGLPQFSFIGASHWALMVGGIVMGLNVTLIQIVIQLFQSCDDYIPIVKINYWIGEWHGGGFIFVLWGDYLSH